MMLHCKFSRSVFGIALCTALLTLMAETPCVSAADGQPALPVGSSKRIRARGRLPNHYADVVTEKQRKISIKFKKNTSPRSTP